MQKRSGLLLFLLFAGICRSAAQHTDNVKAEFHVNGAVTVTNNGISLIPTFTLGKPAAIFDLSLGKKKIFFEPQLRFGLDGKPWSFIFWWRYRLLNTGKLKISAGAHPSLVFRTVKSEINGVVTEAIQANRYLAVELAPNYSVAKGVSVGVYYLYSHGIDRQAVRNTNFITLNSNFSNIKLGKELYARFIPQVYYLKQDKHDGLYVTSMLTLAKNNFPLSVQGMLNKTIRSDIPGSRDFVWNTSIIYSFGNTYVKSK
jgi:hypothetical protein